MSELTTGTVDVSSNRQSLAETCRAAVLNAIERTDARITANFEELEASAARLRAATGSGSMAPSALKLQLDASLEHLKVQYPNANDTVIRLAALSGNGLGAALDLLPDAMQLPEAAFSERLTLAFAHKELENLQQAVRDTAKDLGFIPENSIEHHRAPGNYQFTVRDKEQHNLTVVAKLGNDKNLQLMLDLDGYDCNHDQCNNKMQEIVAHLAGKGFILHQPTSVKHHQPQGILRKILSGGKKETPVATESKRAEKRDAEAYLTGSGNNPFTKQDNLNKQ
ncbi:MAG: hypothetical protein ACK5XN_40540 [Bacteroidota bacterium]|jgi:hypothetical protein